MPRVTRDRTPPQLQQTTPTDDATGVAINANLILTFNEAVKAGTGNIQIRNAVDGRLVQSIAVTDTSKVTFAGNQLTVNPGSDLSPETSYYVTFASGVVRDLASNAFAGISSAAVFSFTTEEDYIDTTGPVILFTTPDEHVIGSQNVMITFNEPVRAGSGEIEIRNVTDDSLYLTISVDDGQVSFSGRTVAINPIDPLPTGSYYVAIAPSAFEDLYGNDINGAASAAIRTSFGVVAVGVSATAYGASASVINQGAFASAFASATSAGAYAVAAFASAVAISQSVTQTVYASEAGHIIAGNDVSIDMTGWNYDAALNGTLAAVSPTQIDILGTDGLTYRFFGTDFNTAATTVAGVGGIGIGLIEVWAGSGAGAHIVHVEYNRFHTLQHIATKGVIDIDGGESTIVGSSDDDVLFGFAGDDLIIGRDGDDVLHGDDGDDTLIGGLGTDQLFGGTGEDDFVFVSLEDLNGDTIEDIGIGDRINLSAIDGLLFSGSRPPTPFAGEVRNIFQGGNTYVLIHSNGDGVPDASLRLNGGQFVFLEREPGSNVLEVNAIIPPFGLTLTGDGFRNTIVASDSQDVITGGGQGDTLTGGAGPDRFVYNAVSDSTSRNYDTITDFNAVADVLDLWFQVIGVDASITGGSLGSRRFDSDLASAVNGTKLAAHHTVLFTPSFGVPIGSKFLIVDANGVAGYQAGADLVILLGANAANLGSLTIADFV